MILTFPLVPDKHIADVSYEQAKENCSVILQHYQAMNPVDQFWFREAQEPRTRAFDLMMRVR